MIDKNIIRKFLNGEVQYKKFDKHYANLAKKHQNSLTKPKGSLGKLEKYAIWMAGWQKKEKPTMNNFQCLVFVGNHGIAKKNGFRTMQEMGHDLLLSGDLSYSEFERVLQS